MDRVGWQQLAEVRAEDARALLATSRWSCAYYVAGYAIECALKACVLRYVEQSGIIFDDPKFLGGCRTHDLEELLKLANLQAAFGAACGTNPDLKTFWGITTAWSEESRYRHNSEADANQLIEAITHDPDGVLRWIRNVW